MRALINCCRHRGALVCREREGNARQFYCMYHGWTYHPDGRLKGGAGRGRLSAGRSTRAKWAWCRCRGSKPTAISISPISIANAVDLDTYLGRRQGLHRSRRRPVAVGQDGDHLRHAGIRHQGELEASGREQRRRLPPHHHAFDLAQLHAQFRRQRHAAEGRAAADPGFGHDLGNGHLTTDNPNYRGRPVAKWISVYGEDAKADIDAIRNELVRAARRGARRARRRHQPQSRASFPISSSTTARRSRCATSIRSRRTACTSPPGRSARSRRPRRSARAGCTRSSPSTAPAASPRPTTSRRSKRRSTASPPGARCRGPICRAAWATSQRAARHRRGPSARVLAQVERADGGAGMNELARPRPSRAPKSRICSITRPTCSIPGGSTTGSSC